MRQRMSQLVLCTLILVVGCKGEPAATPKPNDSAVTGDVRRIDPSVVGPPSGGVILADLPAAGSSGDEVVPTLPEATKQQLYDQALLEAIDHLAERDYKAALASLEKAQKINDTGAVQREIYKVQAMLDQQSGAEKAVQDVKAVLDDGKADEAAKLAGSFLSQYGGGDRADELAKLKQEADAVVSASYNDNAARKAALRTEAETAITNKNFRAAAVALEQAVALGEDAILSRQLAEVQAKLATYDDCRTRAAKLRKDPLHVEEALSLLKQASEAWPTLLVQQEIDECQLVLERRRDRVSVADLEVLGDVGGPEAGRAIAAELLPHFRPRFDIVERSQINRVLAELNLAGGDVLDSAAGRSELGRSARLRYLVVGSLSSLGGVTLQARLVEVSTGLITQTARVSAPTVEALLPKLKNVALMLQMTDEQKQAFEEALIQKVTVVKPIEDKPIVEVPPPPLPPAARAPLPPPIVTYTPRRPELGGIVVEDFARLPVVVVPPPPPPALVFAAEDPRRNRLFRLSIELGDNCFRRGQFREAQRHFQLAFTVGGPRREVSLRLDSCRPLVPPPPVVVVAPPPQPSLLVPVPVAPPVVIARPRVAVFGWVCQCRPGLVPPAASDMLADQFASYCRGSYEIIDRGEVCWYMGRLNLTMREVLNDEVSRRCLAQALHARYFVFGSVRETASFDVETHLVDPETGTRAGTGKIHVQNQDELKLRMSDLARQIGAKPDEQKKIAAAGAASEKALTEARASLTNDPGKAAAIARDGLKVNPNSTALQALVVEADRRARAAKLEADRKAEAARQAAALEQAKKRQTELAKQSAEAAAKAKAEADARGETQRKAQLAQRERAATSLRAQAKLAMEKGNFVQAVQQLQSAANLQPGDAVEKELAAAKVASQKATADRAAAEQKKREEVQKAEREKAALQAKAEKDKRDKEEADRRKTEDARAQSLHDGFLKQANAEMAKKEYAKAIASAESARRYRPASTDAANVIAKARQEMSLANAKDATERKKIEDERLKREEADKKVAKDRETYTATMKKAQELLLAKKFDEAAKQYGDAAKLFDTPQVKDGLRSVESLRAQEKKRLDDEKSAKDAAMRRAALLKEKLDEGKRLRDARQYAKAVEVYKEAVKIAPQSVDAVAGQSAAERERDAELRDKAVKMRQDAINGHLAAGNQALAKKQFGVAEKAAREALKLSPENAAAKKLLADATAKPTPPAEAKGKAAMPPPAKKDAATKQREEDYKLAMDAGAAAMKKQNYAGAVNSYSEALKKMPGDKAATAALADAQYGAAMSRGAALMKEKKFADAVKAYDEALKSKPGDAAAIKGKKEADAATKKK